MLGFLPPPFSPPAVYFLFPLASPPNPAMPPPRPHLPTISQHNVGTKTTTAVYYIVKCEFPHTARWSRHVYTHSKRQRHPTLDTLSENKQQEEKMYVCPTRREKKRRIARDLRQQGEGLTSRMTSRLYRTLLAVETVADTHRSESQYNIVQKVASHG